MALAIARSTLARYGTLAAGRTVIDTIRWEPYEVIRGRDREAATFTPYQADLAEHQISFMRATDMAVVISPLENEIAEIAGRGIDIRSHRKRRRSWRTSSRARRTRSGLSRSGRPVGPVINTNVR